MRPVGRSLFLRIFFWFWVTMIATGLALIATFILQRGSVPERWREMLFDIAHSSGAIAVAELERGGVPAVTSYINRLQHESQFPACLFDASGNALVGVNCASFQEMARQTQT